MPDGAQSWKMIKTPGSHNNRTTQACDRCRCKKVRCDGKRPSCSQCLAVGFECKITDKLSRRAFPRGYTESLEDRIRELECENHKLVDLIDLKDEQLELVAKVHDGDHKVAPSRPSTSATIATVTTASANTARNTARPSSGEAAFKSITPPPSIVSPEEDEDDTYLVHQVDRLLVDDSFQGSSAGGIFTDCLIDKLKSRGPEAVLPVSNTFATLCATSGIERTVRPFHPSRPTCLDSRLTCDKLVTTYFQEWHSLYNLVDQPGFLKRYDKFMNQDSGNAGHKQTLLTVTILQVLSLGALASSQRAADSSGSDLSSSATSSKYAELWKTLFTTEVQTHHLSLDTVRAFNLALLYALHTGHTKDIWYFRMMAVNAVFQLGLHKSVSSLRQLSKASATTNLGSQASARSQVFWAVYALDAFASAFIGSPRRLDDRTISIDLPQPLQQDDDLDACQLSWITFSRILGSIIDEFYSFNHPEKKASYKTIIKFEDQLESWKRELPAKLKFEFANGMPAASVPPSAATKPAGGPTHQKSPLLYMFYHYGRILLHMPASAPADVTSTKGSGSTVAALQSAKAILQVANYLDRRNVVATLCLNPSRLRVCLCSVVLYSAIDYSKSGALMQDAKTMLSGSQTYLAAQVDHMVPGALSVECFQWFDRSVEVVVRGATIPSHPWRRRSSNQAKHANQDSRNNSQASQTSQPRRSSFEQPVPTSAAPAMLTMSAAPMSLSGVMSSNDYREPPSLSSGTDTSPSDESIASTVPKVEPIFDDMLQSLGLQSELTAPQPKPGDAAVKLEPIDDIGYDQVLDFDMGLKLELRDDGADKGQADGYLDFWNATDYANLVKDPGLFI